MFAADDKLNENFSLKNLKMNDLLLLSSVDLNLGSAKELKEKVKTMEALLELINSEHTALALVKEG